MAVPLRHLRRLSPETQSFLCGGGLCSALQLTFHVGLGHGCTFAGSALGLLPRSCVSLTLQLFCSSGGSSRVCNLSSPAPLLLSLSLLLGLPQPLRLLERPCSLGRLLATSPLTGTHDILGPDEALFDDIAIADLCAIELRSGPLEG